MLHDSCPDVLSEADNSTRRETIYNPKVTRRVGRGPPERRLLPLARLGPQATKHGPKMELASFCPARFARRQFFLHPRADARNAVKTGDSCAAVTGYKLPTPPENEKEAPHARRSDLWRAEPIFSPASASRKPSARVKVEARRAGEVFAQKCGTRPGRNPGVRTFARPVFVLMSAVSPTPRVCAVGRRDGWILSQKKKMRTLYRRERLRRRAGLR